MKPEEKISTGLNDRPRNETIGQSGEGLPDDTSRPVEVDESQVAVLRRKLGAPPEAETLRDAVDLPRKGPA